MKRLLLIAFMVLALPLPALAGTSWMERQVQLALLVSGHIEVGPQGQVAGYTLDRNDAIPAGVRGMLADAIGQWRFEPVLRDGHAVNAKASMHLRLVARKTGDGQYRVWVASAWFGDTTSDPDVPHALDRPKPRYPAAALRAGVEGTVYLVVRIDRQGKVADGYARQVDLRQVAPEHAMNHWRDVFAGNALGAVRHWTFRVPAAAHPDRRYWTVQVPVAYSLFRGTVPPPDPRKTWVAYVPGPEAAAPWGQDDDGGDPALGADALPEGAVALAKSRLVLLTPLSKDAPDAG